MTLSSTASSSCRQRLSDSASVTFLFQPATSTKRLRSTSNGAFATDSSRCASCCGTICTERASGDPRSSGRNRSQGPTEFRKPLGLFASSAAGSPSSPSTRPLSGIQSEPFGDQLGTKPGDVAGRGISGATSDSASTGSQPGRSPTTTLTHSLRTVCGLTTNGRARCRWRSRARPAASPDSSCSTACWSS